MTESTEQLQTLLNAIHDKFEAYLLNQSAGIIESTSVIGDSDFQIKKQLETQPQTPLKQSSHHCASYNEAQLECIDLQSKILHQENASPIQNSNNQAINEYQLELTYSPQKTNQSLQTSQQRHHEIQSSQQYERILNIEPAQELQEELVTYLSLTQKFEEALSKLKHTHTKSHQLNDFASRQQQYMKKKKTDLNHLREQRQKQVSKLCPARPLINSRSQHLLVNHEPIQNRYQTILEEKKKKLEKQAAQKMAKKNEQQQQELIYIKQHQQQIRKKLKNNVRSEADYYNQMKIWVQRRDQKIENLAQKKKQQAINNVTFKPAINPKSQLLMKKNASRIPIYEKVPQPKNNLVDSNCTFKPNLKKTLKK